MATQSVLDDTVAGQGPKGHGRKDRPGRSVRRPRKPRHQITRARLAALTPEALEEWDVSYGLPVLAGKILTGKWVYLAVLRHYLDLQGGAKRGLVFVPAHG